METNEPRTTQPNGEIADESGENFGEGSGWTTTKQAAKVLGVSRRMVQEYVRRGELEAFVEGQGVNKTYYVSIDSLNSLRERRRREAGSAPNVADISSSIDNLANQREGVGEVLFQTIKRLETRAAEAADLRARLELSTQAESTLREALERERSRADRAEEELGELRRRLQEHAQPRGSPQKPSTPETSQAAPSLEEEGPAQEPQPEPQPSPTTSSEVRGEVQMQAGVEERRRSWWRRFFFGP